MLQNVKNKEYNELPKANQSKVKVQAKKLNKQKLMDNLSRRETSNKSEFTDK